MKLAFATIALVACATDGDQIVIEPGRVAFYDYEPRIDVPATGAVGQRIDIGVVTFGGGCVSLERTDLEQTEASADVWPLDRRVIPDTEVCTLELLFLRHEASVTFETPGTKTIVIHGRRVTARVDEVISVPMTLEVSE